MPTTMKLIAKTTLGSNAADVTLSSIPSIYTDLYACMSVRSDRASALVDGVRVQLNGDTTDANYAFRNLQGDGASTFSGTGANGRAGVATAANSTANTFATIEMYVPNYAGGTNKSWSSTSANETNSTTAYLEATGGLWNSTAAVTAIRFFPANGTNFVSGSSFFLYGITKA